MALEDPDEYRQVGAFDHPARGEMGEHPQDRASGRYQGATG